MSNFLSFTYEHFVMFLQKARDSYSLMPSKFILNLVILKNQPEIIHSIWLVIYTTFPVYIYYYLGRELVGRCIPDMPTISWTQALQRLWSLSYCCVVTIMASLCSHKHPQSGWVNFKVSLLISKPQSFVWTCRLGCRLNPTF